MLQANARPFKSEIGLESDVTGKCKTINLKNNLNIFQDNRGQCKTFGIILLLIYIMLLSGYGQQFEVEGHITYSMENKKFGRSYQNIKRFVVERDNDQWKIRTFDENEGGALNSYVSFDEAGYDGTNIFYLEQDDKQKLKSVVDTNVLQSDRFALALGRVMKADAPYMDPSLIYPVWLAYASLPYFTNLGTNKAVCPLFVQDGLLPQMWLPVIWSSEEKTFISDVTWFSEGKYAVRGDDGNPEIKMFPPPYDNGFRQAHFQIMTWTNFNGQTYPNSFSLTLYEPAGVANGVTNFDVGYIVTGTVEVIKELSKFSPIPELTTRTSIKDFRYKFGDQTISYLTTSNWYTEQQITDILDQKGLIPLSMDTMNKKRIWVISIMAAFTIFPILLFIRKMNSKKQ